MAQWRKVFAGMPEDLSSNPRKHYWEKPTNDQRLYFQTRKVGEVGRKVEKEGRKVEIRK